MPGTEDTAPATTTLSEGGSLDVPVQADHGLAARVGDLDDCVLATHVLWKQSIVGRHMAVCLALEFVVQLVEAVRAQGGLWLVGDWYLMPNGSLISNMSEGRAWDPVCV